jgi:hypothetical protein
MTVLSCRKQERRWCESLICSGAATHNHRSVANWLKQIADFPNTWRFSLSHATADAGVRWPPAVSPQLSVKAKQPPGVMLRARNVTELRQHFRHGFWATRTV